MASDSDLRTRLRSVLLEARRSRDAVATSTVRTVLAALENAEAVPMDSLPAAGALEDSVRGVGATDAPRRTLTAAEELAVVDAEIASLDEVATAYDVVAPERADAARAGIDLLNALRR